MRLFNNQSTIYGPVKSWRQGLSLGVDPLFHTSTCSFNCLYCQLGEIQLETRELKEYVSLEKIISDYKDFLKKKIPYDIITYAGSGEPSLAANLGQIVDQINELTPHIEQAILTNGTELYRDEVQENLSKLNKVIIKLDSGSEEIFQQINRPSPGIHLKGIINSIKKFKENYTGQVEIQSMFMPLNNKEIGEFIETIKEINPHSVQLNSPSRPYPQEWHKENRGNHDLIFSYPVSYLKKLTQEQILIIEERIKKETNIPIKSVLQSGDKNES